MINFTSLVFPDRLQRVMSTLGDPDWYRMTFEGGRAEIELSRLSPGDYFGEGGMFTDSGELGTIRAMTFAVVYEVGQAALAKLMHDRPSIADEIGVTLSLRAKVATSEGANDRSVAGASSISALVLRIRQLFEVPHGSAMR